MSIEPQTPARTLTQMVATEIKVQMARQDVRQSQLARKMGKTEMWLSVRLRGKQAIDVNDLALIAKELGVGIHDLLPPPDEAAEASVSVRNPFVTDRPTLPHAHRSRGREVSRPEGPTGRTDSRRPSTPRRTSRLPRPGQG